MKHRYFCFFAVAFFSPALFAAEDPVAMANKADVLKYEVKGMSAVAVHEVTDTAGKVDKQIYTVVNQVTSGNSFIVISSENSEINGTVYLIKGQVLYAAAPNQRSFVRLGALNLDRRISGSLYSHWDLQGNIPAGIEYTPSITSETPTEANFLFTAKKDSHYKKATAVLDKKTGLFTHMEVYDAKGLLKTIDYSKVQRMGTKIKKRLPTVALMKRAEGRSDLPVAQTKLTLCEIEFDPSIDYDSVMATSDQNLQTLRSKYVLGGDRFRSVVSEAED